MKNSNLRGLDQDLNRGIEHNKKHGGVSDELKKMAKRPESFRNGEGSGLVHTFNEGLPVSKTKCKCGNTKFDYQKVCGACYLKNQSNEIQRKKV